MHDLNLKAVRAAPPRFEHGFEAPQASVISKLHYRATSAQRPPQYKREGASSRILHKGSWALLLWGNHGLES